MIATEAELVAQNAVDQENQGVSLTEPDEQFEYETPDGKVVVLDKEQAAAVQHLLDKEEEADRLAAKVAELEAKTTEKAPEKAAEAAPEMVAIEPVEWQKVGENFQAMLEGEMGGVDAIGPALQDVVIRTILTDPYIADQVGRYIDHRVAQREQGAKAETSFKEFVGDEVPDSEVKAFMQANPWAQTKKEALIGIRAIRGSKEADALKVGKEVAHKEGKKQGEKEALLRAKARGTLRPLTGAKGGRPGATGDLTKKYDITDTDQRSQAMAEFIKARRASGKT
jgi:hypothetical protein